MLEINNVHKSFGKNQILKGVDLKVEKGDIIVILGPSGSGKTTLLRCINFLERAEEGTIIFDEIHTSFKGASKQDISRIRKRTGGNKLLLSQCLNCVQPIPKAGGQFKFQIISR